ncbi:MAG TPA: metal-dependent hydrolase [Candidatus Moranbacteria bacterium]|nr:metal-dependent hydrolase [Candidatus Moranbacteria bacterium]
MDILAHGLWAGSAGKAVNLIRQPAEKEPLKLKWMVVWGIFPDFFAFAISFSWMIGSQIFPFIPKIEHLGPGNMEPVTQNSLFIMHLTHTLYNISHSLFIFFLIFGLAWLIFKKPVWVMTGWLLHILMDIPSHSYDFYPTPFLWPISDFKINGFHWGTPWFMITNYSLIIIAYLLLYIINKRNKKRASL